jgi:hypothetical protein
VIGPGVIGPGVIGPGVIGPDVIGPGGQHRGRRSRRITGVVENFPR